MELCNTEDALMENVLDYNLFDRVPFVVGTKVYTFTRPEFANILETGLNPWTNVELPLMIKIEIAQRLQLAKELKLPKSAPILDLLTQVEKGELEDGSIPAVISGLLDPSILSVISASLSAFLHQTHQEDES